MYQNHITVRADTFGHEWHVPVMTFAGNDPDAPRVYMQAGLHADELPGVAVLHFLCGLLRTAEADGQIAGDITIVPQANPVGSAQFMFLRHEGRFDIASRTNFNRDFPRIRLDERLTLIEDLERFGATDQLKRHLLHQALGHDIVLDLHCDAESLAYAYFCEPFWPGASDLAAALELEAVFLADGTSSAFEEAVAAAWMDGKGKIAPGRLASTIELRGQRDVSEQTAMADAKGLMRFLCARGVIHADLPAPGQWRGPAIPLDNIEIIKTPESGTILFHHDIGETVAEGDLLATIITAPGTDKGICEIRCPQNGLIATRANTRFARRHMDLMKILCDGPARQMRKPGALED
ncbi:MAG TPA: peptidase M14 [Rhizobiales bacterium]|nr:peptidase M14 [Hyphomicrobiales bacterium]